MRPHSFVTASLCAILVPVVSGLPATARGRDAARPQTAAAAGVQPADIPVRSTRLERRDAARGLAAAIEQITRDDTAPLWLAWKVPSAERRGEHRAWSDSEGRCVLEDDGTIGPRGSHVTGGTSELVVLIRSEKRHVTRVTFTDARCTVDAGTRPVYWLAPVRPADSVAVLAGLVREDAAAGNREREDRDDSDTRRQALPALAMHGDPAADGALATFVEQGQPRWLRKDAAFWLGAARGAAGAAIIDRLARHDPDDRFREHLTFVLTLTGDTGLDTLLALARDDASPRVRGQALFWLGQKAGQRATGALTRALDDDPDRDVRKKAVFALSQLPRDQGVPKLIDVARSHRDPEVRKQAMFWLGQSGDPRAVAFFEEVLKR